MVGLANGQSPTEPILRRREDEPPAAFGHPQYAVQPEGRRLRGGRFPMVTLRRRWQKPTSRRRSPAEGLCKIRYVFTTGAKIEIFHCNTLLQVLQQAGRRFRGCPLSHTHRPLFSRPHATRASRATFEFPQNSFVWENKKIDSRPYSRHTNRPAFLGLAPNRPHDFLGPGPAVWPFLAAR